MYSKPDLKSGIRKRKGKIAILNITSHCNVSCVFCSEGDHARPVNVSLDVIKRTISKFSREGVEEVNFMGGETTLRDDYEEILKSLRKEKIASYLVTNAIRFCEEKFAKRILNYLNSIEISLHAPDRSMFKEITGVDAFDRVIEGIKNVRKYHKCVAVFFIFVPNSMNYDKIVDVFKLLRKIMGKEKFLVHVKTLNIEGKVEKNTDLVPDYGEFSTYLKRALSYALKNDISVVVSRFPLCLYSGYEYLCLEIPLELRSNEIFLNNNNMLREDTRFEAQRVLCSWNSLALEECDKCSLARICPQPDLRYLELKKDTGFLRAQRKTIKSVVEKMIKHSYFFKMDYFYHDYPFKCDFDNEEQVKSESVSIEKILLSSVKKKI